MADRSAAPSMKDEVNRLIAYHSPIARALTDERTTQESRLIPMTAYVVTACVESFLRYPDMVRRIEEAMPADEVGRRARVPGCRVNTVHLWSIANFWLLGRKVMQQVDPGFVDDVGDAHAVLSFWERAALAYRGDGTLQAWDTGTVAPYDTTILDQLRASVSPVADDAQRGRLARFNATLVAYLFLVYFDTRVGAGDTGPYLLPDGRVLLVRDFYQLGPSDFPWSDVASDVPFSNLTAALVLEGVSVDRVTDFGTTYTTPEDYLDHLVGFGLCTGDGQAPGELRPVALDELEGLVAEVRRAQASLYRRIASMSRDEKIRCGAYVYFSFLRPFAQIAGVTDSLDWTVPRDTPEPLYQLVSAMEGDNRGVADDGDWYALVP